MKIISKIDEIRELVKSQKKQGSTVGFVPTMGYLHEGHISLMEKARENTDFVVVSIFVNPSQFGPNEDFESYPRDIERDASLCEAAGVDAVFYPEVGEMYPRGISDLSSGKLTYVKPIEDIAKRLCGGSRPGHFSGVATIVAKLFNIVAPDMAFFGQKDAQQLSIIENMVRDLDFDVEIVPCPIVREDDGLAKSSRNARLTPEDRIQANILYKALMEGEKLASQGEKDSREIIESMNSMIESSKSGEIDYIKIVDGLSLEDISRPKGDTLIAVAVRFGDTRLIDNIRLVV